MSISNTSRGISERAFSLPNLKPYSTTGYPLVVGVVPMAERISAKHNLTSKHNWSLCSLLFRSLFRRSRQKPEPLQIEDCSKTRARCSASACPECCFSTLRSAAFRSSARIAHVHRSVRRQGNGLTRISSTLGAKRQEGS